MSDGIASGWFAYFITMLFFDHAYLLFKLASEEGAEEDLDHYLKLDAVPETDDGEEAFDIG